jgi:N-acetylglucosamine-6-sulfatase
MRGRSRHAFAIATTALTAVALLIGLSAAPASAATSDPNVILITTDDQTLKDMSALPTVSSTIGGSGVTFKKDYDSYPLCCPSRVTMLTGQYAHNHQVLGNGEPAGGYGRFLPKDSSTLPVWMRAAGYRTIHIGKMPNGYGFPGQTPLDYVPPGWSEFYGYRTNDTNPLPLGGTIPCSPSSYFDFCLNEDPDGRDGPLPVERVEYTGQGQYQTDVYRDKAVARIGQHFQDHPGQPLFMEVMFFANHTPDLAAPRTAGANALAQLPKDKGFNEKDIKDKPKWLRKQAKNPMKNGLIADILQRHRERLDTLLAMNDAVGAIVNKLAAEGKLGSTDIIFTSDNGYSQGQHRIHQGKYVPYEPSSHVPLLMRGPGIPAGTSSNELVMNVDIVPTILEIGHASPSIAVDGRSFLPIAKDPRKHSRRPLLLETGDVTGTLARASAANAMGTSVATVTKKTGNLDQDPPASSSIGPGLFAPRYKAIRTTRYLYVKWADSSRELYDMKSDPFQLDSKWKNARYKGVRKWIGKRLGPLSKCAGASCRRKLPKKEPKPLGKVRKG